MSKKNEIVSISDELKEKKICLIGAAFETDNMGVEALAAGTIKSILNAFPKADISLLDYGRQGTTYDYRICGHTLQITFVNIRFNKKIYARNNIAMLLFVAVLLRVLPLKKLKNKIIQNNPCLKHISDSELFVSISGGDSFSDIYGLGNFLYVTMPQILILMMGKNLVLMPQTLGPYGSRLAKRIATFILNRAARVYVRDYLSLQEIITLPGLKKGENHINFCYDVGFILDPVRPANIDIEGLQSPIKNQSCIIGFNISGLLCMGGYTNGNRFGFRLDYRDMVKKVIDFLIREKQAIVLLVPHVFGTEKHPESDSVACRKLYNELKGKYGKSLALVQGEYDKNGIKYIIGMCDFFIGSRMHACIAAISQNIPAVSIAYSRKFKGLMETIEMGDHVADPREMDEKEILDLIGSAYDERDVIKEKLNRKMPEVKERVSNLIKEVSEALDQCDKRKVNRI